MSDRKRFEQWARQQMNPQGYPKYSFRQFENGEYVQSSTQAVWETWQSACPDGWQCVPKESTRKMQSAGAIYPDNYADMLAAAPKPEDT